MFLSEREVSHCVIIGFLLLSNRKKAIILYKVNAIFRGVYRKVFIKKLFFCRI